ncbi:MAG: UDP-N-acetylmuramoyl-L-alanine--D-glutamate ligase [Acidobacteriota bacterium]
MAARPRRTSGPPKLEGKRVVVIGAARSGLALTRFLVARGASVVLTDLRGAGELGPEVAGLRRSGVELQLGGHDVPTLLGADLVAVSPGVPLAAPPLAEARRKGARIVAEVELASRFLRGTLIGISGSNGKSTTTALTAHLLSGAGLRAIACGNLGTPLSDLIESDAPDRHYVVELSSFQLEGIDTLRPRIAVLLNLSPDHQDRYPDARAYYAAKRRIFLNQRRFDHAVLNRDDPTVWRSAGSLRARVHPFSRAAPPPGGAGISGGRIVLRPRGRKGGEVPIGAIPLFGDHNLDNAMAALLVADICGVPTERAAAAIRSFRALPHRLERVAEVGGVAYFNDSKATNVGATRSSLASFPGGVVLILGGRDKGGDFRGLVPAIRERVTHLVLMGESRDRIAEQVGEVVPTTRVEGMAEAVEAARQAAPPRGVVLLAPGCASFDRYAGFEQRGDDFRRRVLALAARGAAGPGSGALPGRAPSATAC